MNRIRLLSTIGVIAGLLAVLSMLLFCATRRIVWINDVNDGEWHGCTKHDRLTLSLQDGSEWEFGMRADGVVVWRKSQ